MITLSLENIDLALSVVWLTLGGGFFLGVSVEALQEFLAAMQKRKG